mmetsp:Transcript_6402/g.12400  ORF Transcript_6402/g.12400 Transcript_6402/m.12400 type:complete len:323 (-) Transcript_6402:7-975(-)
MAAGVSSKPMSSSHSSALAPSTSSGRSRRVGPPFSTRYSGFFLAASALSFSSSRKACTLRSNSSSDTAPSLCSGSFCLTALLRDAKRDLSELTPSKNSCLNCSMRSTSPSNASISSTTLLLSRLTATTLAPPSTPAAAAPATPNVCRVTAFLMVVAWYSVTGSSRGASRSTGGSANPAALADAALGARTARARAAPATVPFAMREMAARSDGRLLAASEAADMVTAAQMGREVRRGSAVWAEARVAREGAKEGEVWNASADAARQDAAMATVAVAEAVPCILAGICLSLFLSLSLSSVTRCGGFKGGGDRLSARAGGSGSMI